MHFKMNKNTTKIKKKLGELDLYTNIIFGLFHTLNIIKIINHRVKSLNCNNNNNKK